VAIAGASGMTDASAHASNVYDHFFQQLGRVPNEPTLRNLSLDSERGRDCQRVIDVMKEYLATVRDRHPDAVTLALQSASLTVEVIWLG
jgi:hypothetical protein